MIAPATSTPLARSMPSRPGELLISRIFGPSLPSSMSTPAISSPITFVARTAALRYARRRCFTAFPLAPRCRLDRNSPGFATRRIAATTLPPMTMARTSRPFDSRMYSCSTMSCPMAHSVSRSDATACGVSAIIVPIPCVPCWSFTIAGQPPTISMAASTPAGERAQTVIGTSTFLRVRSWSARSLSRLRAIATAPLRTGMPMRSNCRTTASP